MIFSPVQFGARRRAWIALMILFLGALAPALSSFAPEPVTCGMACCEESGVCCCLLREGEDSPAGHRHEEEPALTAAVLTRGCTPNCGLAPTPFPGIDSSADPTDCRTAIGRAPLSPQSDGAAHAPSSIAFASRSPRAPPAFSPAPLA